METRPDRTTGSKQRGASALGALFASWWHAASHASSVGRIVPVLALLPLALVLLLPPFRTDDLIYHLLVPKHIAQAGFFLDPHNINTNLPMLFEVPLVVFEWMKGVVSPFAPNLAVLAVLVVTMVFVARRQSGVSAGLAASGALLFAYSPVVFELVSSCYVELFFALVIVVAFAQYLHFQQHRESRRYWWVAMALLGIACSTKYFGLIYLGFVAALEFFLWRGPRWRFYAGIAVAALIASPWYIRNWVLLGNPVFPLLSGVFPSSYLSPERAFQFERLAWNYHDGRALVDYLLLPLKLIAGRDPVPVAGRLGFDGVLGGVLLLSVLGLRLRTAGERTVTVLTLGYFAFWAATSQQVRFLLPVAILSAIQGLQTVMPLWQRRRWMVIAALGIVMVQNLAGVWRSASADRIPELLTGRLTREQFLTHHLPVSYGLAQRINGTLDPTRHRLLTIGNFGRDYYFDIPTVTHTYYDTEFFDKAFSVGKVNPTVLERFLREARITHVLFNWTYYLSAHSESGMVDIAALRDYLGLNARAIFAVGGVELLELVSGKGVERDKTN